MWVPAASRASKVSGTRSRTREERPTRVSLEERHVCATPSTRRRWARPHGAVRDPSSSSSLCRERALLTVSARSPCPLSPVSRKQNSSAPGRRSRGTGRNRRAAGGGGARENPRRCGRSAVSGVGTKRGGRAGGGRSLPSPPSTPGRPWPGCKSVWSGGLPRSYTEPEELVAASPSPAGGHRVLACALDHRLSACRGHTGGLPSPAVPQAESRGKPPVTSASLCLPLPLCLRRP